ncbi:MAG: hypothetical protein LBI27_07410 [Clostridiales bacterium]|jgi:hypothetical protein|nr:hypothetical protein [Clostridiales bacterium]
MSVIFSIISDFISYISVMGILALPFLLTAWNIFALVWYFIKKREWRLLTFVEAISMVLGAFYLCLYIAADNIMFVNWDTQLYNTQRHGFISPENFLTVGVILAVAFVGYILIRFIPAEKQSPVVSALGIAAVYLGAGICVLFAVQTATMVLPLLLPVNCLIVLLKSVYILVVKKNELVQNGTTSVKFKKLSDILNAATMLPWYAIILTVPLLGIIVVVLLLFGQEPSSIIKAWTETSGWTMSQQVAPPNISYPEHYLCTVAAGGHKKIVKPLRTGIRHGRLITINRQLCVANAFEQVLSEKNPALHRFIRKIYDNTGYPISKLIKSKLAADAVYLLMKPLEWVFTAVLYTVDVNPEDRIAAQYHQ